MPARPLLTVDPKENLPIFCEGFSVRGMQRPAEAAAMALGKSRLAEALDPLKECLERSHSRELRQHILLAVAILRRPAAIDYLVELVSTGPEPNAVEALSALGIYKDDPVCASGSRGLPRDGRAGRSRPHLTVSSRRSNPGGSCPRVAVGRSSWVDPPDEIRGTTAARRATASRPEWIV